MPTNSHSVADLRFSSICRSSVLTVDPSRACRLISEAVGSSSSTPNDIFYALKANSIAKCKIKDKAFQGITTRLNAAVNGANSLLDFYYSVGGLVIIKSSKADVHPANADGIFKSVKAFSQSDGRWRYSSNNPESSAFAAGIALETLAGVVSLAFSELDQSLISTLNNDISKLFDSIEKHGTLATTSSVVRGLAAFAALPGNKILGLANFFLGIGVPGDAKDLLNQIDSLTCLESNRQDLPLSLLMVSIPLILSLPATVLSLTKKDSIQVKVNTVLGSNAPPLTVKLVGAFTSGSKEASLVENQIYSLSFVKRSGLGGVLKDVSGSILASFKESAGPGPPTLMVAVDWVKDAVLCPDVYVHIVKDIIQKLRDCEGVIRWIVLHKPEDEKVYVTEGPKKVPIFVSGLIKIENAEVAILDSDLGRIETQKKLDVAGQCAVSLSANHLQKLRALLKLRHESKVEHIFVVGNSGEQFEIVLNFLGVVEKFFSLSGRYDIELTVGDVVMENSLLRAIGHIGLDVPEPPEKAPRPPPQPVDPYSRYGPKEEITHIFRAPEKRPKKELSFAFLGLSFLPLLGLSIGFSLACSTFIFSFNQQNVTYKCLTFSWVLIRNSNRCYPKFV
ncbi:Ribophorin II (RPN2) family protein isoform 4 [Hibiscus syriacus]|uniref:Dolichyl-diphosphooligosaccharide--protein glycosyltransferase subunit 2 n=1 Tax=Hibiscus syriacus TaxID=106335 RepID=A0A6A2YF73_HIBSY|nr:Ribophorin II (RPN2) family protein isoform 4 [Hibiscus syriacus]